MSSVGAWTLLMVLFLFTTQCGPCWLGPAGVFSVLCPREESQSGVLLQIYYFPRSGKKPETHLVIPWVISFQPFLALLLPCTISRVIKDRQRSTGVRSEPAVQRGIFLYCANTRPRHRASGVLSITLAARKAPVWRDMDLAPWSASSWGQWDHLCRAPTLVLVDPV